MLPVPKSKVRTGLGQGLGQGQGQAVGQGLGQAMGQTQGQGLGQGHGLGQGQSRAFAPPSVADLEDLLDADNDNAHDNDDDNDDNNGRGGSNVRHAYVDDGGDGEDDGYGRNSHNDRRGRHRQPPQQQQQQQQQHHKQNPQQQQQHEIYQQQHDNQGKKQRKGPAPAQGLDVVSGARGMDESVPYESRRPHQDDRNHRGKGIDKGHTESSLRVGDSGPGTRARSQSRERPPDARARDQGPPMLPLPRKDKDKDKNVSNDHTDSQSSSNVHHHDNTNSSPTRRQKGDKGKGKGKTAAIVAAAAAGGRGIVDRVDEEAQLLAELYALEQRQQQKLADLSVYAVGTTVTTGPSASAVNLNSVAFVNAGVGVGVGVGGSVDDNHPSNSASHGKPSKADPLKDREKLAFKPGAKDHRCVTLLASCLATHPHHTINHHLTFIKPPRPNQSQIILIESNPFSSLTYLIFSFQLHPSLFRRDGTFGVPAALPKVKKAKKPLALVPDAWGENDPLGPSPDPGAAARGGVITGSIISKIGSEGASGGPPPLAHGALGIADLPPPVTNQKAAAIAATLSPSGGCVHWHTPSLTHIQHTLSHTLSYTFTHTHTLSHTSSYSSSHTSCDPRSVEYSILSCPKSTLTPCSCPCHPSL